MCCRSFFPIIFLMMLALHFILCPFSYGCISAPSEPVVISESAMEQAPFRISTSGSQLVFSCELPEYCSAVNVYAAFISPSGRVYYPGSDGRVHETFQPFRENSTASISQILNGKGHIFPFGAWQIYWYIIPQGMDNAYEFGSCSVNIPNPESIYADTACLLEKPEYSVSETLVKEMLEVGLDYFKSRVEQEDKDIVHAGVTAYPEGNDPLAVSVNADGEPELLITSRAAAYYAAGVETFFQNNKAVSTWCFLESASRDPSHAASLNNLAFNLFQYELYDAAKILLLYGKSIAPNYNPINVNLGYACSKLGNHREASYFYQTALFKDTGNPDYLRLLIKSLEKLECSENMLEFFNLLASSMEEAPESSRYAACETENQLPSGEKNLTRGHTDAYYEMKGWIRTIEDESRDDIREFMDSSITPVLRNFVEAMGSCPVSCAEQNGDNCQYKICVISCMLPPAKAVGSAATRSIGAVYQEFQSAIFQMESMLFGYQDELTPDEYADLTDLLQLYRDNLNESYRQILMTLPSSNAGDELKQLVETGCQLPPDAALLYMAFGETNVSFEPSACFMILCLSMDQNGMGAVQLSAVVVTAKVGVDPFTGDTAVQFGIGPGEIGIGPVTAEASLYLKIEGNEGEFERVGLQPTIGLGPLEVGYFFGLERVSNP